MRWESVPDDVINGREPYAHHQLPLESEGDGHRMQQALAAALGKGNVRIPSEVGHLFRRKWARHPPG